MTFRSPLIWFLLTLVPALAAGQDPAEAARLQQSGDWTGAEAIWRQLVTAHPRDYRFWTSLGVCLAHQNKLDEAITDYKKALAIQPQDPVSQLNLGLAYFKLGRFEDAISPLKSAVASMPENTQAQTVLGMSFYGAAKYQEAIAPLAAAQARSPDNAELELVLARSYLLAGDYAKAQSAFESMLRRDPDSAQVHLLLGQAYDALGKPELAEKEFRLVAAKSDKLGAHLALGYLFWRDKRYDDAASEFRKELASDTKQYQALAYLGDTQLKQGHPAEAEALLKRSVSIKDTIWLTHYDLGVIATGRKEQQLAMQEFRRAAELDPDQPDPHYRLAQGYKAEGRSSEARKELDTVTRLHAKRNRDLVVNISGRP